jgi:hypothetical protein
MRQLIEDLISAMEYHVEQTRPIHTTTVALQAAREALRAQPAPVQEPYCYVDPVHLAALNTDQSALVTLHKNPSGYASRGLYTTLPAQPAPVQVSPLEFVTMVMEKEHLVGKPLFWAEWPNKENT